MRFQSSLLVLGVVAANLGISQAAPVRKIVPKGAVPFTSKAQGFAVWLPVKPVQIQESFGITVGGPSTQFKFEAKTKAIFYEVVARVNPAGASIEKRKRVLVNMTSEFFPGYDGDTQKSALLQLNGFTGREIQINSASGAMTRRVRCYSTPRFSYLIIASGLTTPMQKQAAQIAKVFDSFRILPQ